jgi:hypothetical protein
MTKIAVLHGRGAGTPTTGKLMTTGRGIRRRTFADRRQSAGAPHAAAACGEAEDAASCTPRISEAPVRRLTLGSDSHAVRFLSAVSAATHCTLLMPLDWDAGEPRRNRTLKVAISNLLMARDFWL